MGTNQRIKKLSIISLAQTTSRMPTMRNRIISSTTLLFLIMHRDIGLGDQLAVVVSDFDFGEPRGSAAGLKRWTMR